MQYITDLSICMFDNVYCIHCVCFIHLQTSVYDLAEKPGNFMCMCVCLCVCVCVCACVCVCVCVCVC